MVRRNGNLYGRDEHRSSEAIENEVRQTRHEMDETLDELGKRLDPWRIVQDVWNSLRHRVPGGPQTADAVREFGAGLGRRMADHPIPVAIMGAGLLWLLMEEANSRRGRHISGMSHEAPHSESSSHGSDWELKGHDLAGRARSVAESARESMSDLADSARDTMSHASERMGRIGKRGLSSIQHIASSAQEGAHKVTQRAAGTFEEHPLATALVVMGVGMLAGIATPNTRQENRAMGETAEALRRRGMQFADEKAAEVIESTTESMATVAERTADSASQSMSGKK